MKKTGRFKLTLLKMPESRHKNVNLRLTQALFQAVFFLTQRRNVKMGISKE
jgi:hypothetical protein